MSANNQFNDMMKMFVENNPMNGMFKMSPIMDSEGVVAMQRRNFEAMSNMGQSAISAMQALAHRNTEVIQQNASHMMESMREMMSCSHPEQNMAKQMQSAKHVVEQGLSHIKETAEMVAKSSLDMFDKMSHNISKNMSECCVKSKTCSSESKKKSA
jgi:phasin family protein